MFGLGLGEILIICLFLLIFIGPKKLPELARGLGKGIREFQKASQDLKTEIMKEDSVDNSTEYTVEKVADNKTDQNTTPKEVSTDQNKEAAHLS